MAHTRARQLGTPDKHDLICVSLPVYGSAALSWVGVPDIGQIGAQISDRCRPGFFRVGRPGASLGIPRCMNYRIIGSQLAPSGLSWRYTSRWGQTRISVSVFARKYFGLARRARRVRLLAACHEMGPFLAEQDATRYGYGPFLAEHIPSGASFQYT